MSLSELFKDLDPTIAGPLEKVTAALQEEIRSQIDGVRKDVRALSSAQGGAAPARAGSSDQDAIDDLKHAIAGVDGASDQGSILAALLEASGRFSSRSAFFLLRPDGAQCWGSLGFEGMHGQSVSTDGDSSWARIGQGEGTLGMSAEECADFCSQFGATAPQMGALFPLSLGDHIAGCLYVDQLEGDSLNISALQVLTFVAGQTLETLPVRRRSSTPALVVAAAIAAPAAAVEEAVEIAEPVAEPIEEPAEEPVEPAVEESVAPELEPAPEEPEPAAEEPESEAPALEEPEALDAVPEADDSAFIVDAPVGEETSEPEIPIGSQTIEIPVIEEPVAEPEVAAEEVAAEEPPAAEVVEPEPAPPEPVAPAAPPAAAADMSATQVMPPEDVLGPGWAFTAKEEGSDTGTDALHEEARRLARLLVTEIKLYNEEQVDQGRRSGDLYRRLQEDIDRSRQIFDDRIDEQVRTGNEYFKEALVRILAGGDESLLGM